MAFDLDPVAVLEALRKDQSKSGLLGPDPADFKFNNATGYYKSKQNSLTPNIQTGLTDVAANNSTQDAVDTMADSNLYGIRMAGDALEAKMREDLAYRKRLADERYARRVSQGQSKGGFFNTLGNLALTGGKLYLASQGVPTI
jgi:hypothetical protein